MVVVLLIRLVSTGRVDKNIPGIYTGLSQETREAMSRHNYIVGNRPYLAATHTPIYLVPTGRLKVNPYHWKPGKVIVIAGWPFGDDTLDDTTPTPTQESQEQPIVVEKLQSKAIADYEEWYDSRR